MQDATGAVQSVAIFGGASEIGQATARALIRGRTRRLVLAARHPERLDEQIAELRRAGAESIETVAFDAQGTDAHAGVVDKVFAGGDIDVVLVAFGVLGDQQEAEEDPGSAVEVMRTNAVGGASVCLRAAQRLRDQGHGTLVVLSTVAAERPRRSNYVYGASKAGLDWVAQGLGDALHGTGVEVIVVRPGFVRTKMTAHLKPVPFSTTADAVAGTIAKSVGGGSGIVWVPGILRWIMTILRHVPRPIFRRLPL